MNTPGDPTLFQFSTGDPTPHKLVERQIMQSKKAKIHGRMYRTLCKTGARWSAWHILKNTQDNPTVLIEKAEAQQQGNIIRGMQLQ
jgi:hypothetical protein